MTFITLVPIIDPSDEELKTVTHTILDRLEKYFADESLNNRLSASVAKANVVVNGLVSSVVYEDIEFIVTARYRQNGELWLRGEGFEINASALIRAMRELIS